jgi:hypothetical protein
VVEKEASMSLKDLEKFLFIILHDMRDAERDFHEENKVMTPKYEF